MTKACEFALCVALALVAAIYIISAVAFAERLSAVCNGTVRPALCRQALVAGDSEAHAMQLGNESLLAAFGERK